jgi:enoyl-[acyl-carrier-protein] reductase (NADH)
MSKYSIISNTSGVVLSMNHDALAFRVARDLAKERGEMLFVYYGDRYMGEVTPDGREIKEVITVEEV